MLLKASFTTLVVIHFVVFILLIIAAWQDYKTREISNWITVPIFFAGLIFMLIPFNALEIIFSVALVVLWYLGKMGGADAKVLIGLFGLWSNAAFVALFALGVWGLILLLQKKKKSFPGLVVIALGSGLTFFQDISIMLLKMFPPLGGMRLFFI